MTEDKELRARQAAAIADNPLFNEALDTLEASAIKSWLDSKDPMERERLWMWTNQARALRTYFDTLVSNARFDAERAARAPLP